MTESVALRTELDASEVAAIGRLAAAAEAVDGVAPISEQGLLRLQHRHDAVELVATDGGTIVGYLQLDVAAAGLPTAELVVDPESRGLGHGTALIRAALARTGGQLAVWAHGDLPAAAPLAAAAGLTRQRVLHRMRRPSDLPLADYPVPEGVVIRAFRPGVDDEAWVALNARAFAGHPEQSRVTVRDLRERMAEPWFDAAGFFLAERAEPVDATRLVGFHWTKVHPDENVGEIYVIGLDPDEQGSGLAKPLVTAGLAYLRDLGLPAVILYADASNTKAVGMYERIGFEVARDDVLYETTAPHADAAGPTSA